MRRLSLVTLLPLMFLAACQSAPPSESQRGRPCTDRTREAGQCVGSSLSSFPELSNVQ